MDAEMEAEIAMIVDLVDPAAVERLPESKTRSLAGVDLPLFALAPFEASAVVKLRCALMAALDPRLLAP
jgi:hypothetical protein